jgi:hypothetical protein
MVSESGVRILEVCHLDKVQLEMLDEIRNTSNEQPNWLPTPTTTSQTSKNPKIQKSKNPKTSG